ncbi:hypothetical protein EUTSA_v10026846mg [Eutrema salsugineum]|uniref:RNI-like superfamily protein n=1 Tax=Eutrema salsugineum TaxID=72664 RepID=V4MDY2_EUTSA|nr:hypothetical protein EUTSA_v10026846mg [Eutrema salsugineum]
MSIAAIAKRRKLLDDDLIISLADSSWEILDVSGSDVSNSGLAKAAEICKSLRAVDISRCNKITYMGVSELVQHCRSLETLRCGGCRSSESKARRSLSMFKPNLSNVEGETWEELDTTEIGHGVSLALDEPFVKYIDPETWVVRGFVQNPTSAALSLNSNELPIAEKFRLAFVERDARLAPKRAKNARQHQRRAERNWMMSSDEAKAIVFASKATRSLHKS